MFTCVKTFFVLSPNTLVLQHDVIGLLISHMKPLEVCVCVMDDGYVYMLLGSLLLLINLYEEDLIRN